MQHLLRAITGPTAGAVYVLGERTVLGRAADCDVQLLHDGVSRHHAKLSLGRDGTLTITDLSSDNGTFAAGTKVGRTTLRPGDTFYLMDTQFVFEAVEESVETSPAFLDKETSSRSLRRTGKHAVVPVPDPSAGRRRRRSSSSPPSPDAAAGGRPPSPARRPSPGAQESGYDPGRGGSFRQPVEVASAPPDPGEPAPDDAGPRGPVRRGSSRSRLRPATPDGLATERDSTGAQAPDGRAQGATSTFHGSDEPTEPASRVPPAARGGSVRLHRAGADDDESEPTPEAVAVGRTESERTRPRKPDSPRDLVDPTRLRAVAKPASQHGTAEYSRVALAQQNQAAQRRPSGAADVAANGPAPRGAKRPTPRQTPRYLDSELGQADAGSGEAGTAEYPRELLEEQNAAALGTAEYPGEELADANARARRGARHEGGPHGGRPVASTGEYPQDVLARDNAHTIGRLRDVALHQPPVSSDAQVARDAARRSHGTSEYAAAGASEPDTDGGRRRWLSGEMPEVTDDATDVSERGGAGQVSADDDPRMDSRMDPRMDPPVDPRREPPLDADTRRLPEGWTPVMPPHSGAESGPGGMPLPGPPGSPPWMTRGAADGAQEETGPLNTRRGGTGEYGTPIPSVEMPSDIDTLTTNRYRSVDAPIVDDDVVTIDASELEAKASALARAERDPTNGLGALARVLQYREFRLRQLRGEALRDEERDELARLARRLQQPTGTGTADTVAALRRYQRFDCAIRAELTHRLGGSMSTLSVGVQNIGAGGAKLIAGQHGLAAGDVAWLAIDVSSVDSLPVDDAKTVVFKSRVVWVRTQAAELGVVFAGAPRYDAAEALAQDLP